MIATVVAGGDGRVRLVLEDAAAQLGDRKSWAPVALFTHVEFDEKAFLSCELSEKQLADIGLNVVARLSALSKA